LPAVRFGAREKGNAQVSDSRSARLTNRPKLIILDQDAEPLFHFGEQGRDCHRIELGQGAE